MKKVYYMPEKKCKKHGCSYVTKKTLRFPGKTVEICPECQKESIEFFLPGIMAQLQKANQVENKVRKQ